MLRFQLTLDACLFKLLMRRSATFCSCVSIGCVAIVLTYWPTLSLRDVARRQWNVPMPNRVVGGKERLLDCSFYLSEHLYAALGPRRLPTELGVLVSRINFPHEKTSVSKHENRSGTSVRRRFSSVYSYIISTTGRGQLLPGECERALQALRRNLGA